MKNPNFFSRDLLAGERTLLVFASIVGLCAGFGSWGFTWLIGFFREIFMEGPLSGLFEKHWYLLPLSPMLGGLLVAPLSHLFPTEAKGHGVPEVMAAVALKNGILKPRTIFLRAIASAITIGSGGSAGREGPIVQIGSAIGSSLGQMFRLHGDKIKILLGCGAAGGIAATFNAPLAGMVFSMEIILGDFTASTVTPIIISSVIATAVSQFLNGNMPVFTVPEYHIANYLELFFYGILGAVCGLCALLYMRTLYWCEDFFDKKVKAPNILKPAIGGLVLGLMALFLPNHEIMGNGYPTISQALRGDIVWQLAFLLVFLKIVGTSVTLGSGGSGGIFAPALFIGAMAGLSFGYLAHSLFPDMTAGPGAYALVGMGAVVAAATHAPLTSIFILFELTNKYEIILPIMISCIIATAVAKGLHPDSIYTLKLSRRGIKLHRGQEESILASVLVKDVMSPGLESIPENTPFRDIISIISRSRNSYFPIVDGKGDMTGILSFSDIREVAFEEGLADLVVAKELATANVISLTPNMNLNDAMEKFFSIDVAQLPVVDEKSPRRVIGILTRGDIIAAYNRRVLMRGMGK